jgi:hypothetical protein
MTILAFLKESWPSFFLAIISIIAIFCLRFFFRKSSVIYPKEIEIALVLFVGLSFMLDEFAFASEHELLFDIVKHIISGALFGIIAFVLVYALNHFHKSSLRLNSFFVALFAFTFSTSFSFLWIIFENIVEGLALGVGNVHDGYVMSQLWTLSGVLVGAGIVSMAGYQYLQDGTNNMVGRILNKFFRENPSHKTGFKTITDDTKNIIAKGETDSIEFKSTLRINIHTNKKDKRIEHAVLKTICAFLNSNGGILFIGVDDDGKILGLESDDFVNEDKFQLHFTNLFNQHIGEQFATSIQSEIIDIDDKQILRIDCFRSEVPVFLKSSGKEEFFIRVGAATQELQGSKLMEYIGKNF